MTKFTLQKLAILTAGVTFSLAVIESNPAPAISANLVSRNFVISNLGGPLAGNSYTGSFQYDASLLANTGNSPVTNFSFNFSGLDEIQPSGFPIGEPSVSESPAVAGGSFSFNAFYAPPPVGSLAFLFNIVCLIPSSTGCPSGPFRNEFVYGTTGEVARSINSTIFQVGDVTYSSPQPVPEPQAIMGTLLALSLGWYSKKMLNKVS